MESLTFARTILRMFPLCPVHCELNTVTRVTTFPHIAPGRELAMKKIAPTKIAKSEKSKKSLLNLTRNNLRDVIGGGGVIVELRLK